MAHDTNGLHEFCYRSALNFRANPLSVSRVYYWWKLRRSIKLALQKISLPPGLVVDVGAGAGDITQLAYEVLGAQWRYLATDLNPSALAFAEEIFEKLGVPAKTQAANASGRIPLEDSEATLVVCSEVLEHLPDPGLLIGEIHRILKPGGIGIFTTPNSSNSFLRGLKRGQQAASNPQLSEDDKGPQVGEAHVSVLSRTQWKTLFSEGGFDCIRTYRGALIYGHARHEHSPFHIGAYILLDALLDWLPGTRDACEDLCYVFQKR